MLLVLWLNDYLYLLCMAMTGGASALVTLMERIAHKVGMFYVVNMLCT